MKNKRIALLTTVINWDLYKRSSVYFPDSTERYVIDGTNGMYGIESIFFMIKKLKNSSIDWLVMADEDVLFIDPEGIHSIIDKMEKENFLVCGARDGGAMELRNHNPNSINTFFSIINFRRLKQLWNSKEILKNQYILQNEFDDYPKDSSIPFDAMSLYESYYCFYFWLRRKGEKILFLNAKTPFNDGITTLLFDTNNKTLLYHTWFARVYGKNEEQTTRIDEIFNLLKPANNQYKQPIIFKDKLFFLKKFYRIQKRRIRAILNFKKLKND